MLDVRRAIPKGLTIIGITRLRVPVSLTKSTHMKRTAHARWNGNLREGRGTLYTPSEILDHTPYTFDDRFAEGGGTNPEELLGAAYAGCFTMAVSAALSKQKITANSLSTKATVVLDVPTQEITEIILQLTAETIPDVDEAQFIAIAEDVKGTCPIGKALRAVAVRLEVVYG